MTDHLTESMRDLEEKSAFVCASCGHAAIIHKVDKNLSNKTNSDFHDRFTDAVMEESEKSSFICENCGHHGIVDKRKPH